MPAVYRLAISRRTSSYASICSPPTVTFRDHTPGKPQLSAPLSDMRAKDIVEILDNETSADQDNARKR